MNSPSSIAYHYFRDRLNLGDVNNKLLRLQSTTPERLTSPTALQTMPPRNLEHSNTPSLGLCSSRDSLQPVSPSTPEPYDLSSPRSNLKWEVRQIENEIQFFEGRHENVVEMKYWEKRLQLAKESWCLMSAQRDKFFKEKELQEFYSIQIADAPKILQPAKKQGEGVRRTRKRKHKEVEMTGGAGEPGKRMKLRPRTARKTLQPATIHYGVVSSETKT